MDNIIYEQWMSYNKSYISEKAICNLQFAVRSKMDTLIWFKFNKIIIKQS